MQREGAPGIIQDPDRTDASAARRAERKSIPPGMAFFAITGRPLATRYERMDARFGCRHGKTAGKKERRARLRDWNDS